jgi:hypothetical protein
MIAAASNLRKRASRPAVASVSAPQRSISKSRHGAEGDRNLRKGELISALSTIG